MSYWIVIVDDEPLSLTNAKNLLRSRNMRVSCLRSGEDLLLFIKNHTPDLILLDILMPGMDGFDTYRALRHFEDSEGRARLPVIFLTGEDSNEAERRGLKAGASDFIHKPFDEDILVKRIRNIIENSKTIESLTEEVTIDRLTGFLNKASGTEKIEELCRKDSGALMIMDLDNFKLVNDIYGHDMGDRVLVSFAGIVRQNVRFEDVISRIGGDEFMGFFEDLVEEEAIAGLVQRLNESLMEEADVLMGKDHGIPLGISVGAAITSPEINDYQLLFRRADSALYEVKRGGKHGYEIYDPDKLNETAEENIDDDLQRVIRIMTERGEGKGAMLLGQDAFSWNYRFIERFQLRYGGAVTRMLFSLSSEEKGIMFTEMVSEFGNVLRETLRRTDIILRWQQNQYFVVLPQLEEREMNRVIDRIINAWNKAGYQGRLKIEHAESVSRKESYEQKRR